MNDLKLPGCSVSHPACGACGKETDHDGDSFYCDECNLDYGDGGEDSTPTYRDEEAEPCAEPCDNTWHHKPGAIRPEWSYACAPCSLPEGHTSDHWTPCEILVSE